MLSLLARMEFDLTREKWGLSQSFQDAVLAALEAYEKKLGSLNSHFTKRLSGITNKVIIDSKVATKVADRAFNLASAANLGVVALQKTLATPRLMTKQQSRLNQLAKKSVDELFITEGAYDWMRPALSDEDLEILDEIEKNKMKSQNKNINS